MEKDNPNLVDETMQRKDVTSSLTQPENPRGGQKGFILHPFGESGPVLEIIGDSSTVPAEYLAVGPMDGRYAETGKKLSPYFSEFALVKYSVMFEVYWLVFLLNNLHTSDILNSYESEAVQEEILSIYRTFSGKSFMKVNEFKSLTNNDVKSVVLFVAERLKVLGFDNLMSFVHFGCTSEDIINVSYAKMISSALEEVWIPAAEKLINVINIITNQNLGIPMLTHTHGEQPVAPTSVSKEFAVYLYRLRKSLKNIQSISICAKLNGDAGNYSGLSLAFPEVIWQKLSEQFIEGFLQLDFDSVTTQIGNYDCICNILDGILHFNNVLRNLDLDMLLYISKGYFKQIAVKPEVGNSSFENSEANIKMSNAICNMLSNELPISSMQRDLSDSSLLRNIGVAFAYSLQAIEQAIGGLQKIEADKEIISADINSRWEVLLHPIQAMLLKYGISDGAYSQIKKLTEGGTVYRDDIHKFINSLDVLSDEDKTVLLELAPAIYTGYADDIAKSVLYDLEN